MSLTVVVLGSRNAHAEETEASAARESSREPLSPPARHALGLTAGTRLPVSHQRPFSDFVYLPFGLIYAGPPSSAHLRFVATLEVAPTVQARCSGPGCHALYLRIGPDIELRASPSPATPWASAGIGIERVSGYLEGDDFVKPEAHFAPEAHVQAGFDFGRRTTFGPLVLAAADVYGDRGYYAGQSKMAVHGWIGAGVRAMLGL